MGPSADISSLWQFSTVILLALLQVFTVDSHSQLTDTSLITPAIIGGNITSASIVPWQVALADSVDNIFCGGTLIDPWWVLTAAHCFDDNIPAIAISGASSRSFRSDPNVQIRIIQRVIIFPNYASTASGGDLALLKVSATPFNSTSSDATEVIALDSRPEVDTEKVHTGLISGFGISVQGGVTGSWELQSAEVPLISNRDAQAAFNQAGEDIKVLDSQITAGNLTNGGVDACRGDSGGPLVTFDKNVRVLTGITSYGIGCALPKHPGIYTRVSFYKSWIDLVLRSDRMEIASGQTQSLLSPSILRSLGKNAWFTTQIIIPDVSDSLRLKVQLSGYVDANLIVSSGRSSPRDSLCVSSARRLSSTFNSGYEKPISDDTTPEEMLGSVEFEEIMNENGRVERRLASSGCPAQSASRQVLSRAFECLMYKSGNSRACEIVFPSSGSWFISVRAVTAFSPGVQAVLSASLVTMRTPQVFRVPVTLAGTPSGSGSSKLFTRVEFYVRPNSTLRVSRVSLGLKVYKMVIGFVAENTVETTTPGLVVVPGESSRVITTAIEKGALASTAGPIPKQACVVSPVKDTCSGALFVVPMETRFPLFVSRTKRINRKKRRLDGVSLQSMDSVDIFGQRLARVSRQTRSLASKTVTFAVNFVPLRYLESRIFFELPSQARERTEVTDLVPGTSLIVTLALPSYVIETRQNARGLTSTNESLVDDVGDAQDRTPITVTPISTRFMGLLKVKFLRDGETAGDGDVDDYDCIAERFSLESELKCYLIVPSFGVSSAIIDVEKKVTGTSTRRVLANEDVTGPTLVLAITKFSSTMKAH